MKSGKIYLIFFLFVSYSYSAQFESMLNKKYSDKVFPIRDFYAKNMRITSSEAVKKSDELKSFAKKNNDISLELEAEIYLAYYNIHHHIGTEKERVDNAIKIAERGRKENVFDIEARAIKVLRDYYWYEKKNYEIGFEYGLKLDKLLSKTSAKDFPDLPEFYYIIGSSYYLFRDYHTSIKYFKKILEVPENSFNWRSYWNAANTLGLCYQKLNKIDSSDYYLKKSLKSPFFTKDSIFYTISVGNLAYNLYRKGKFREAEPLFDIDISNALKNGDYALATGSMIPLADIFIYQGKTEEAWKLLQQSRTYIQKSGQNERLENLYPVISHWYESRNMKEKAILYKDSAMSAINNNNNTFSGLIVLRVQQKIDRQKLENTEQKLEQANRNRKTRTVLFFVFLAIISAFILLYYFYMKRIYQEKNRTKEAELQLSAEKLENAKQEINSFLKEIENKNQLIDQLKNTGNSAQNSEAIEEIKKTAILTDDDWTRFRVLFEQVHSGFLQRLKEKYPEISPAEIRYLTLAKLQFSTKEMAAALGVSTQSIRTNWYRIRKKLNLSESMVVAELIETI